MIKSNEKVVLPAKFIKSNEKVVLVAKLIELTRKSYCRPN